MLPVSSRRYCSERKLFVFHLNKDALLLGVLIQDIPAVFPSDAGLLVSAEGNLHWLGLICVDPEHPGLDRGSDTMGAGKVFRDDSTGKAIVGIIGALDDFVLRVEFQSC